MERDGFFCAVIVKVMDGYFDVHVITSFGCVRLYLDETIDVYHEWNCSI